MMKYKTVKTRRQGTSMPPNNPSTIQYSLIVSDADIEHDRKMKSFKSDQLLIEEDMKRRFEKFRLLLE